jgi:chitin synthase
MVRCFWKWRSSRDSSSVRLLVPFSLLLTSLSYEAHLAIYILWVIIFVVMCFEVLLYHVIFSEFIRQAIHPFKTKHGWGWSFVRFLAKGAGVIFFHLLRIPIFVFLFVTFPGTKPDILPPLLITVSIDILMFSYVIFVVIPIFSGFYNLVQYGTGSRLLAAANVQPHVFVAMPIYNEGPESLVTAVKSIIASNYRKEKIHLFCSFDDLAVSPLFLHLLASFGATYDPAKEKKGTRGQFYADYIVEGVNVVISRCPHGGKRSTNQTSHELMTEYAKDLEHVNYLWVDSDIVMYDTAINNAVSIIESRKCVAVTGYISVRTKGPYPFLCDVQNAEYLTGQVCLRAMESYSGAATCLPGAFVLIKKDAFEQVVDTFFHTHEDGEESLFDFHRMNLGEDRYLSHLLMETFPRGSIAFASGIRSKTEAPDTFRKLVKQRRRWLLGAISNEVAMFTCLHLYPKFPLLILWKYLEYSLKSVSFVSMLTLLCFASGQLQITLVQLILVLAPLVLLFLLVIVLSFIFNRLKMIPAYLVYALINPFVTIWVMAFAVYSWRVRTWGGPRSESQEAEDTSRDVSLDIEMEVKGVPVIAVQAPTRASSLLTGEGVVRRLSVSHQV